MSESSEEPIKGNGFTPIQRKMMAILSDGEPHTKEELHKCLWDELSPVQTVAVHIYYLRKKLRSSGRDIVSEQSFQPARRCYRLASILPTK